MHLIPFSVTACNWIFSKLDRSIGVGRGECECVGGGGKHTLGGWMAGGVSEGGGWMTHRLVMLNVEGIVLQWFTILSLLSIATFMTCHDFYTLLALSVLDCRYRRNSLPKIPTSIRETSHARLTDRMRKRIRVYSSNDFLLLSVKKWGWLILTPRKERKTKGVPRFFLDYN